MVDNPQKAVFIYLAMGVWSKFRKGVAIAAFVVTGSLFANSHPAEKAPTPTPDELAHKSSSIVLISKAGDTPADFKKQTSRGLIAKPAKRTAPRKVVTQHHSKPKQKTLAASTKQIKTSITANSIAKSNLLPFAASTTALATRPVKMNNRSTLDTSAKGQGAHPFAVAPLTQVAPYSSTYILLKQNYGGMYIALSGLLPIQLPSIKAITRWPFSAIPAHRVCNNHTNFFAHTINPTQNVSIAHPFGRAIRQGIKSVMPPHLLSSLV